MTFEASPQFNYIDNRLADLWSAKRAGFIGEDREAFIKTLVHTIFTSATPFILIEGDPGVGKSAVAAMLPDKFESFDGWPYRNLIRCAFSLAYPDINSLKDFTEYVCGCLQQEFGIADAAALQDDWGQRLRDCLLRAADSPEIAEAGRVLLLIDGLEECPDHVALLEALPRSNKIVYILFAQPGVVKVNDGGNFLKITLPFLAKATAKQILKNILGKKWNAAAPSAAGLLKHSRNLNPLILTEFAAEFTQRPAMSGAWWGDICGLRSYFLKSVVGFDAVTRKLLGALACAIGENLTSKTLTAFADADTSVARKSMQTASRFVRYAPDSGGYEYRHNAWKTFARQEFSHSGRKFALWCGANAGTAKVDDNGYSVRHGVRHLIAEKEWAKAARLLTDFDFLMRRAKEGGISSLFSEYAALSRHCHGPVFRDWADFFREKGHLLFLATKAWGAERILFQLAWEDGEDSLASAAAVKYAKKGKADWERMLADRPKHKSRSKCLVIQGGRPTVLRDGRILATYENGYLRVWDAATGACKAEFYGHTDKIFGKRQLRDGRLLSWSEDATLRIWDTATGVCEAELKGHTARVEAAMELKDGRILSCSVDKTLRLWNAASGECEVELKGHLSSVRGALELLDGRVLSWSWQDSDLCIWNTVTGECETELKGHTERVHGAIVLSDGRLLSCSLDATLRLWDAASGACEMVFKGHTGWVVGVILLKNGRLLSWARDGTLRAWDIATGKCEAVFAGPTAWVRGVVELSNGKLLSWSEDNTLRLWHASTGVCEAELKGHTEVVSGAIELKNGKLLSWARDSSLRLWSAATGICETAYEGHSGWVSGAVELSNGRLLSWSNDKTLRIWATGAGEKKAGGKRSAVSIRYVLKLKNGRLLSWVQDKTLRILDASTDACITEFVGHTENIYGALELQDSRLLSWSKDKTLRIWNAATGACETTFNGHADCVYGAIELQDKSILSWSADAVLCVWDAASGECKTEFKEHVCNVAGAIELRDGRILSWDWNDSFLRIWNASSGVCEMKLEGHTSWMYGAIQLRKGKILSWSRDGTLRIWDAAGGCVAVFDGHACAVWGAFELANGDILSWATDKTMRIWNAGSGECKAVFAEDIFGAGQLTDGRLLLWGRTYDLRIWDIKDKGASPVVWLGTAGPGPMLQSELSFPLTGQLKGDTFVTINLVPAAGAHGSLNS